MINAQKEKIVGARTKEIYISTDQRTYKPEKWPLTKAIIVDVLHPLFIRLKNQGFLDMCKQGSTQNSNIQFIIMELFSERAIQPPIRNIAFQQFSSLLISRRVSEKSFWVVK